MSARLAAPSTVFAAPEDNTAAEPPEHRGLHRDEVRLLVADQRSIAHRLFRDLPSICGPATCWSSTPRPRWPVRSTAGPLAAVPSSCMPRPTSMTGIGSSSCARLPMRAARFLDGLVGEVVSLPDGLRVRLLAPYPKSGSSPTGRGNRLWRVQVIGTAELIGYLARHGRPIAYGYLNGRYGLADYQTIFATRPGSAEMPSAAPLHCGAGHPACHERYRDGADHPAHGSVVAGRPRGAAAGVVRGAGSHRAMGELRPSGRRGVVAVGTTVTRALESAAGPGGTVTPRSGWTEMVITPEHGVTVVDGLITGWHNPEASHLLLVEAVAGVELTQRAYDAAVAQRYLWHEFGDAGLLLAR